MGEVDYSSLDPELQKKIEGWQKNSPANKQLQTLEDLTAITQEIFGILEDNTDASEKTTKELGATLMDIRDKLTSLNDKEAPKMPDHAKPVVGAIDDLKAALTSSIKGIELRPDIKVGSPEVHVPKVDLSELEKVVKNELPKAFKEAIKLIPETKIPKNDYSELADLLSAQINWLESIDTASRMKVQIPSTMKVTNPDGSPIGGSGGSGQVEGTVASGVTDTGNPVKTGGKYNATSPTFTDGQRGDTQIDSRGNTKITLMPFNSNTAMKNITDNADATAATSTANWLGVLNRNTVFNGTTWDRMYGDATNGVWVNVKAGSIGKPSDAYALTQFDDTSSALYEYYSYMDKSGNWYIKRLTIATNLFEYTVPVATTYATGWTGRAGLTYVDYGAAF